MPTPSQKPPASSKAPNEVLKDMDVLCIFKINIESQYLDHWCIKDLWLNPMKIKMPNPSQEAPASSKAPSQDSEDIDVLYTIKIKIKPKF